MGNSWKNACEEREESNNEKTVEISNRDNPSTNVCEATENLHLRVLGDVGGSRWGVAFHCLFLFSSNFLGGAERKVTLRGISTLYRSADFVQIVNGISPHSSILLNESLDESITNAFVYSLLVTNHNFI